MLSLSLSFSRVGGCSAEPEAAGDSCSASGDKIRLVCTGDRRLVVVAVAVLVFDVRVSEPFVLFLNVDWSAVLNADWSAVFVLSSETLG